LGVVCCGENFLEEFFEKRLCEDARLGIANVEPNRALKKCSVRKLIIEYYLSEIAVIIVTPKPCRNCEKRDECSNDFIFQIMAKQNTNAMDPKTDYTSYM
jgi:hypothetical protein